MEFDREKYRKVFDHSGLTKSELAAIYEMSRQTMYSYRGNVSPANRIILKRVVAYTDALAAAIDKNVLPLPAGLTKVAREERLRKMAGALFKLLTR